MITKVDGVESGATANQTGAEIVATYEAKDETNAYTDAEKSKQSGSTAGAEVNASIDWDAASGDALILNKPTLGTAASADTTDFSTAAQGTTADTTVQSSNSDITDLDTALGAKANLSGAAYTGSITLTDETVTTTIGNDGTVSTAGGDLVTCHGSNSNMR